MAQHSRPQSARSSSGYLAILFLGSEYIQDGRFTRLHRLILELEGGSTAEELSRYPQEIHAQDLDGWTALHWACRRSIYDATCVLLENGAGPHVDGVEQRNTLQLVPQSNSPSSIERLLQHRQGNLILDIDTRDVYQDSLLWVAVEYNYAAVIVTFISYRADLNAHNRTETTPILTAVVENAHEVTIQLSDTGANYKAEDRFGNTILHLAASKSDVEILVLLRESTGVRGGCRNGEQGWAFSSGACCCQAWRP